MMIVSTQDPLFLIDSLLRLGPSHDGALERDLKAAIHRQVEEIAALRAERDRMREALEKIINADRWNNLPYTGIDKYEYGDCAKIAQIVLNEQNVS